MCLLTIMDVFNVCRKECVSIHWTDWTTGYYTDIVIRTYFTVAICVNHDIIEAA